MLNSREIPWLRILAEGAAIVASILIAFSIDAWWTNRQLRDDEQYLLSNLDAEFTRLQKELYDSRRFYSAIRESALALIDIGSSNPESADPADIDRHLSQVLFWGTTGVWSNGDLDSAISSGSINLIRNRELRRKLGRWPGMLSDARELVSQDQDFYKTRRRPYLSENMYMPQISNLSTEIPGIPERAHYDWGNPPDYPIDPSYRELVFQAEFQNILWERAGYLNDIMFVGIGFADKNRSSYSTFGKDIESTLELIRSELE
jgi:hypothetical protein